MAGLELVEKIGAPPRGITGTKIPLWTAPTRTPPMPPLAAAAVPMMVCGANILLWYARELGDEIAAVDAVARGERAVEDAVEMVLGEVLHRAFAVARVADREEVEPAADDRAAVEGNGDVVGKRDGRVWGRGHVAHVPLAGECLVGVNLGQEVV